MATDLTVVLEDRPGTMAALGRALGDAGINIDGICGFPAGGEAIAHVLVEDASGARRALEDAGIEVRGERDVVVHPVEDRPGVVGEVAGRIAESGANINLIYVTTNTELVIGADDLEKVRGAL